MDDDKLCAAYECGRIAFSLGFGRDEYEDIELPEGVVDEKAKAAWLKGWDDEATAQQGDK